MNIKFKIIPKEKLLEIIPLLQQLNTLTPTELLKKRVLQMGELPNYECVGAYDEEKLIGISGLWYSVRHYIGNSVEPDHVIIDKNYRGKKIGKLLFDWIEKHTKSKGYEAIELNSYAANRKSHKFYHKENFEIYGFHYVKVTRDDKEFY